MYASKPSFAISGTPVVFGEKTKISGVPDAIEHIMRDFAADGLCANSFVASSPIPAELKKKIADRSGKAFTEDDEGFVIVTSDAGFHLYAETKAGIIAGAETFLHHLNDKREFGFELLWDHPFSHVRGVKVLMPGRATIPFFKAFVDEMAFFRCNTIMIEIGGAMEYKRHPEINSGWEEYATEMFEYSGKAKIIQEHTFKWYKDSIHCQNGGGSWLKQSEVRDLIAYCRERGIEVIPEVPSTSHCDYLLWSHHELAERQDDPYADTFCPSNPDSYKLLFDVFDEVIDVFEPTIMNIGHDEYYSIGVCEKCRKRDAAEIFADDVTKIHDYLAAKGVKTMFWADKVLNSVLANGERHGGAETPMHANWDPNDEYWGTIPATWRSIELLPRDTICLNWYWGLSESYDEDYRSHGYPVIFGNFNGSRIRNFRRRCGNNTTGGITSNWGETSDVYLQRNGIYYEMAYNDLLFWDDEFDEDAKEAVLNACANELFDYRWRGLASAPKNSHIEVVHNTDCVEEFMFFHDGVLIENEKYALGDYVVTYADGTQARLPVILGQNIACGATEWFEISDDIVGSSLSLSPIIREVLSSTLPEKDGNTTWYRCIYENPHPEKAIADLRFEAPSDSDRTVTTRSWKAL